MRGGMQAPERWGRGGSKACVLGASLATFDCGKKRWRQRACAWTPRPFPLKLPLTPASSEAPESVFFTLLEVFSSLALPSTQQRQPVASPGPCPRQDRFTIIEQCLEQQLQKQDSERKCIKSQTEGHPCPKEQSQKLEKVTLLMAAFVGDGKMGFWGIHPQNLKNRLLAFTGINRNGTGDKGMAMLRLSIVSQRPSSYGWAKSGGKKKEQVSSGKEN